MLSHNTPSHSLPGEALCDNTKNHYLGYYSTSRYTGYSCLTGNMTLSQYLENCTRDFLSNSYTITSFLLQKHCTNWFKEVWKRTTICSSSVSMKETKHQTHLLTLHIVKNEINVQRFQPLLKKKWGVFFSAQVAHTSALGASL